MILTRLYEIEIEIEIISILVNIKMNGIYYAISLGEPGYGYLEFLCKNYPSMMNTENLDGEVPLHCVTTIEQVKIMFKYHVCLHPEDNIGRRPVAVVSAEISEYIQHCSRIEYISKTVWCLHKSIINNNFKKVKKEVEILGINVNSRNRNYKYTALHWAAYYNRLEIAKYLCTKGANLNLLDDTRNIPQQVAHDRGHLELEEYLEDAKNILYSSDSDT